MASGEQDILLGIGRDDRLHIAHRFPSDTLSTALEAWCPTMTIGHACILSYGMSLKGPLFRRDAVYVHRPVAALRRNILVQRIPCNALHIVVVLCDFMDTFT